MPGRFFWSAPGAAPYPDWQYINSRNWHAGDGSPWPEFGELEDATQHWNNGVINQIFPNAVNVGDGSCIGSSIIGPIVTAPAGLAQGVDRRCFSVPMPEETNNCSFYNPAPQRYENQFDWAQFENFPVWFNIPMSFLTMGNVSACNWEAQFGQDLVGSLRFFLRYNSGLNVWRLYLARNAAGINFHFRYELAGADWQSFGPNVMNLVFDDGAITPLPGTVTILAGL